MTTRHMHYTCGCEYVGDLASRSCPYHPSHPAIESAPVEPTPPHTGWGVGNLRDCHCLNCQGEPTPEPPNELRTKMVMTRVSVIALREDLKGTLQDVCELVEALDAEISQTPQPTGAPAPCVWRDIASAPKDGTGVLVYWQYWSEQPFVAYFKHGRWNGEVALSEGDTDGPTHWMPLPAPPVDGHPLTVER